MKFYKSSYIEPYDLFLAKREVKIAENAQFRDWFVQWEPWHKVMERIAPDAWAKAIDERDQIYTSGNYMALVNEKMAELGMSGNPDAERSLGVKFTHDINLSIFGELTDKVLISCGSKDPLGAKWDLKNENLVVG